MTGEQFLERLKVAITPVTLETMSAPGGKLLFRLSDGRELKPKRERVSNAADESALDAYIAELVG